jgi:hypothetical protein
MKITYGGGRHQGKNASMIKVQCVGCQTIQILTLEEARNLDGPPPCKTCPMFCVAVEASTRMPKGKRK